MLTTSAYGLAIVLNLLILFIGLRFLLVPWSAAAGYGVPATQDRAYLTIKGIRDGSYGLVGLALLAFAGTQAEAWFMLVVALAPLGDTFVVLRNGGTKAWRSASTSRPQWPSSSVPHCSSRCEPGCRPIRRNASLLRTRGALEHRPPSLRLGRFDSMVVKDS